MLGGAGCSGERGGCSAVSMAPRGGTARSDEATEQQGTGTVASSHQATVATDEHHCPSTVLVGTVGCWVLQPAPDFSRLALPGVHPHPPSPLAHGVSPASSPGIKNFLIEETKSQRSPRCLLKAAFKPLHAGPGGQPCAAAAP